jgi:catechol 2,3-dioxygenase-like lactoylglutathione lyase family enzyme
MQSINSDTSYQPAVRYIVSDVEVAVTFYVNMLGFEEVVHIKDAFASLRLGNFQLYLNKPGAGGAGQSMPDGTMPSPGGWNRFQITVQDLGKTVEALKNKDAKFRNQIVHGVGGDQILLQDPSGNLIELFQPLKSGAK